MPSYYIHMDQGLVADLRNHELSSGQFSSCAPIVLYNDETHHGALYHLGGCDELDELKISHLRLLKTIVRPTVVYVLCGGGSFNMATMGMDLARGHVAPVSALFQDVTVRTSFNGVSTYMAITVSEVAGALDIASQYSFDNALKTAAAIDALPAGITFVGERSDAALAKWA